MDRRRFLAGLAGIATAGAARAQTDPDVVVVGAGMAGLAAARALLTGGYSVQVVEARNRIGGRAFTDTTSLPWPFDRGCTWIHSADVNPLTGIARSLDFETVIDEHDTWLYLNGREASDTQYEKAEFAIEALWEAIDSVPELSDRSVYDALPPTSLYGRLAHDVIGAGHAVDTRRLSSVDANAQIGTGIDRRVPRGFGSLVAAFGRDVPVALGTEVRRIRLTSSGVSVETDRGTLESRAAVVTVPVSILQQDRIAFDPPLPGWKRDAIEGLEMGLLNKVALRMRSGSLPEEPVSCLVGADDRTAIELTLGALGRDLVVGFLGGSLADTLEAEGPAAARAFVTDALATVMGNDTQRLVAGTVVTEWRKDPYARGAYSAALPGHAKARAALGRPVEDRLFFAGEACHTEWATQVPGAYLSGRRAAEQIAAR